MYQGEVEVCISNLQPKLKTEQYNVKYQNKLENLEATLVKILLSEWLTWVECDVHKEQKNNNKHNYFMHQMTELYNQIWFFLDFNLETDMKM